MGTEAFVAVPSRYDPRWRQIVTGQRRCEVENLGLKLLLTTIGFRLTRDGSEASVQRNVDELHGFFSRHARSVEPDLNRLFG